MNTPWPTSQIFGRLAFAFFLICLAASFLHDLSPSMLLWTHSLLLLSAVATTLFSLARSLPAQNVLSVAALIIFLSGLAEIINAKTGLPFGHRIYTDDPGPQLFKLLPWPIPLIWLVAVLNSRGATRFLLRFWHNHKFFGLLVIGLTVILTVVFDVSTEHFALIHQYCQSRTSNLLGVAFTALFILVFTTPWLINKKPAPQPPPDFHPLIVWLLLVVFLFFG